MGYMLQTATPAIEPACQFGSSARQYHGSDMSLRPKTRPKLTGKRWAQPKEPDGKVNKLCCNTNFCHAAKAYG